MIPPDQRVLTKYGFRPVHGIRIGDEVMTHFGHLKAVTGIIIRAYKSDIFHIVAETHTLKCTLDHVILVNNSWLSLEKIRRGDVLFRLCKVEMYIDEMWVSLKRVVKRSFWTWWRKKEVLPELPPAKPLDMGAEFRNPRSHPIVITEIRRESFNGIVYNLEIEDEHSYVCEGVLIHD